VTYLPRVFTPLPPLILHSAHLRRAGLYLCLLTGSRHCPGRYSSEGSSDPLCISLELEFLALPRLRLSPLCVHLFSQTRFLFALSIFPCPQCRAIYNRVPSLLEFSSCGSRPFRSPPQSPRSYWVLSSDFLFIVSLFIIGSPSPLDILLRVVLRCTIVLGRPLCDACPSPWYLSCFGPWSHDELFYLPFFYPTYEVSSGPLAFHDFPSVLV